MFHKMNFIILFTLATGALSFSPPLLAPRARTSSVQAHTRAQFLVVSTTSLLSLSVPPAFAISPNDARKQLDAVISVTDNLIVEWDAIASGGGDAIRRELGTVIGTDSPFFQISKAVKALQNDASDPVAFAEASEEFLLGLGRADSMAYSANFAGGSGKPTPPKVYIDKSKLEVKTMREREREMIDAL
uniref:Uncharacterized protein n=1 Tax=Attheya septentrionalis TaxID=420275 RepID=A0A7S2UA84_9STRA|mmetsp:Transcript_15153/g.27442  ORF Transcript_15153/g.27442 Transcript_15153/m.27442 type:complete len:188 (+) Transcript_15153:96-659(+)